MIAKINTRKTKSELIEELKKAEEATSRLNKELAITRALREKDLERIADLQKINNEANLFMWDSEERVQKLEKAIVRLVLEEAE